MTTTKINLKESLVRTHRPITVTIKIATFERLEREVEKGSWSILFDQGVNRLLDQLKKTPKAAAE